MCSTSQINDSLLYKKLRVLTCSLTETRNRGGHFIFIYIERALPINTKIKFENTNGEKIECGDDGVRFGGDGGHWRRSS